jgi:hypothetical protein
VNMMPSLLVVARDKTVFSSPDNTPHVRARGPRVRNRAAGSSANLSSAECVTPITWQHDTLDGGFAPYRYWAMNSRSDFKNIVNAMIAVIIKQSEE